MFFLLWGCLKGLGAQIIKPGACPSGTAPGF